jgi:hypothetical protein
LTWFNIERLRSGRVTLQVLAAQPGIELVGHRTSSERFLSSRDHTAVDRLGIQKLVLPLFWCSSWCSLGCNGRQRLQRKDGIRRIPVVDKVSALETHSPLI